MPFADCEGEETICTGSGAGAPTTKVFERRVGADDAIGHPVRNRIHAGVGRNQRGNERQRKKGIHERDIGAVVEGRGGNPIGGVTRQLIIR